MDTEHTTIECLDSVFTIRRTTPLKLSVYTDIDCKVTLNKFKLTADMFSKVVLPKKTISNDTPGSVKVKREPISTDLFDINVDICHQFIEPDTDMNCMVTLISDKSFSDIDCRVKLNPSLYWVDHLFGCVKLHKELIDVDIPVELQIDPITSNTDIDCTVTLKQFTGDLYFPVSLFIPKRYYDFSIPTRLDVVYGCNHEFMCYLDVDNNFMKDLESKFEVTKKDINEDIDCTVTLLPYAYKDMDIKVTLKPIYTLRDINCRVKHKGKTTVDIETNIEVTPYPTPVYNIYKEFWCNLLVGHRKQKEFDVNLYVPHHRCCHEEHHHHHDHHHIHKPHHHGYLQPTIHGDHRIDYRVGILVDPIWPYEVYTIQSTLITLLDKYYHHKRIELVYGGNDRANWQINHLGKVFDCCRLEKIEYHYDKRRPHINRIFTQNMINKLFCKPLDRLFIFMERTSFNKSSSLFEISNICFQNNIPAVIISGTGDYIEIDQYNRLYQNFNIDSEDIIY